MEQWRHNLQNIYHSSIEVLKTQFFPSVSVFAVHPCLMLSVIIHIRIVIDCILEMTDAKFQPDDEKI